jgi:hypothetical protein
MSTTFGVKIEAKDNINNEEQIIEVAFRSSHIRWINDIAKLLPDETPVIPLDNSAQGIFTIGDIRKQINEFGSFDN